MSLSRNRDVARAEHVQNGKGHMYRDLLLTEEQIHGELTYVSSITLEPGCSIGVHTHSGDNEIVINIVRVGHRQGAYGNLPKL